MSHDIPTMILIGVSSGIVGGLLALFVAELFKPRD